MGPFLGAKRVDVRHQRAGQNGIGPGAREYPQWELSGAYSVPVMADPHIIDPRDPKGGLGIRKTFSANNNIGARVSTATGPAPQLASPGVVVPQYLTRYSPPLHSLVNVNSPSSAFSAPLNAPSKLPNNLRK